MDIQMMIIALMAVVIPFTVSKFLWPFVTKLSGKVNGLGNGVKQLAITLLNGGLAFVATQLGVIMPTLEQFAMNDMQVLLTAAVGFLTTIVFKQGKLSA